MKDEVTREMIEAGHAACGSPFEDPLAARYEAMKALDPEVERLFAQSADAIRELQDWRNELISGTYADTRIARILAVLSQPPPQAHVHVYTEGHCACGKPKVQGDES